MSQLKIGLVQYSPVWENPEASIEKINSFLKSYNMDDLSLLIFPELSLTGYLLKDLVNDVNFLDKVLKFKAEIVEFTKENLIKSITERFIEASICV